MKKTLLITCLSLLATFTYSQTFTIPNDTVSRIVTTYDNLHNDITNIGGFPIKVKWRVITHDMPTDWATAFAMCDNNMCYTSASSILSGTTQTTNDIAPSTTAIFYALPDVTTATPGTHYVQVRMEAGSQTKDSWYIITKPSGTAIVQTYSLSEKQVITYPNPAHGRVTILFTSQSNGSEVIVRDVWGKTVKKQPLDNNSIDLRIEDLVSGLYIVSIIGENKDVLATTRFSVL